MPSSFHLIYCHCLSFYLMQCHLSSTSSFLIAFHCNSCYARILTPPHASTINFAFPFHFLSLNSASCMHALSLPFIILYNDLLISLHALSYFHFIPFNAILISLQFPLSTFLLFYMMYLCPLSSFSNSFISCNVILISLQALHIFYFNISFNAIFIPLHGLLWRFILSHKMPP